MQSGGRNDGVASVVLPRRANPNGLYSQPSRFPLPERPPAMHRTARAFSLIELLVVAAILLVLASLATVNFADAQARAKVSRAASDMRSIATALEAYAADHNDYPPNPGVPVGGPFAPEPRGREGLNVVPPDLTTPVAYLSGLPEDPFRPGTPHLYDDAVASSRPEARRFSYYRIVSEAEWLALWTGVYGAPTFVSFVAVDSAGPRPGPDGEPIEFANRRAFRKYGDWLVWSTGPDRANWIATDDFVVPGNPASPLKAPAHGAWGYSFDVPYDPTNGTVSFGNVARTQAGERRSGQGNPTGTPTDGTPTPDPTPGATPTPGGSPDPTPGPTPPDATPPDATPPGPTPPADPTPGGSPLPDPQPTPDDGLPDDPVPSPTPAGGSAGTGVLGDGVSVSGERASGRSGSGGVTLAGGGVRVNAPRAGGRRGGGSSRRSDPPPPAAAATPPAPAAIGRPSPARDFDPAGLVAEVAPLMEGPDGDDPFVLTDRGYPMLKRIGVGLLVLAILLAALATILRMRRRRVDPFAEPLTDERIAAMPASADVSSLHLADREATDAALDHLGKFPAVDTLNLWGSQVTDAGLEKLRDATGLKTLVLADTAVTDAGVERIKTLGLVSLSLAGTAVTDAGIAKLERMKTLRYLNVRGTKATREGAERLRVALPNCEIDFTEGRRE